MKKGQQYEGVVKEINFPNKGIVELEDEVFIQEKGQPTRTERVTARVQVKNAIPGQKVRFVLSKKHKDRITSLLIRQIVRDHGEATARRGCGIVIDNNLVNITLPRHNGKL